MIYPYMVGKRPWGTYSRPYEYSVGIFSAKNPLVMAKNSGTVYDPEKSVFLFSCFGQKLTVSYPDGKIVFAGTDLAPPFALCLPVINSLSRADGTPLSGKLISYRELENGHVFYQAFRREAINKLACWVAGKDPDLLARIGIDLGGKNGGGADFAWTLYPLPRFPVTVKLWLPDEEMGGSANLLFDSTANSYLHTEDIAAVGELTAGFIIRHYKWLDENNA